MGILDNMIMLFNIIFILILVDMSIDDWKTREIDRFSIYLLFIIAIFKQTINNNIFMSFSFLIITFTILYLFWKRNKDKLGGADVKIIPILFFNYHISTLFMIFIGTSLAIIYALLKREKEVPYISFLTLGVICLIIIKIMN